MHVQRINTSIWSEANTTKARADNESIVVRPGKVKQEDRLAVANMDMARKESMESAKAVAELSRQLTNVSGRFQLFEDEVCLLKSQISKFLKIRDDVISLSFEQSRHSEVVEAFINLLRGDQDSENRTELTGCDMGLHGKVADAKGGMNKLVGGLRQDIFGSYATIRHNDINRC